MNNLKTITAVFMALSMMLVMSVTQSATISWDFNLPATAVSSQNPPYPSVATLTLVDSVNIGEYVQFTLDPNEFNSGFTQNNSSSTISALNIAYQGVDLDSTNYVSISGPIADATSFNNKYVAVSAPPNNALNLDSSYKVPGVDGNGQLLLSWDNAFLVSEISIWRILNTSIADNFSLLATSESNPSPTFGILSTSAISLAGDNNASSSNWVTGPSVVPVPAAAWLFGTALFGFFASTRRKKIS